MTQLGDFILKHRRDYIDTTGWGSIYCTLNFNAYNVCIIFRYLSADVLSMTDEERDMIDNGIEEFINQCSELINKVKNTIAIKGNLYSCNNNFDIN